ncbi:unnamed protein product, partial [Prorocentrum cordatum]
DGIVLEMFVHAGEAVTRRLTGMLNDMLDGSNIPDSQSLGRRVDIVQRRLLRRMVGWISHSDDTWEDRGRRMELRLNAALNSYILHNWSHEIRDRKVHLIGQEHVWPALAHHAAEWLPLVCSDLNQ